MPPKTHFQKLTLLNAMKEVKNDCIYKPIKHKPRK